MTLKQSLIKECPYKNEQNGAYLHTVHCDDSHEWKPASLEAEPLLVQIHWLLKSIVHKDGTLKANAGVKIEKFLLDALDKQSADHCVCVFGNKPGVVGRTVLEFCALHANLIREAVKEERKKFNHRQVTFQRQQRSRGL